MYHLLRLWQYWEKEVRVWNTLFLAGASQGVSLYILKVFHHKPKPHFWGSFSCIRMKLLLILSAFVAFSGAMSFTQTSPTDGMMWVRRSMGWNSTIEIFQTPFFLSLRKSWKVRRVENIDNCCRSCGKKGDILWKGTFSIFKIYASLLILCEGAARNEPDLVAFHYQQRKRTCACFSSHPKVWNF